MWQKEFEIKLDFFLSYYSSGVEHFIGNEEVGGSIPPSSTTRSILIIIDIFLKSLMVGTLYLDPERT